MLIDVGSTAGTITNGFSLYVKIPAYGTPTCAAFEGNIVPTVNKGADIGTTARRWANIYYVTALVGTSRLAPSNTECKNCNKLMMRGTGTTVTLGEEGDYIPVFCPDCKDQKIEQINHLPPERLKERCVPSCINFRGFKVQQYSGNSRGIQVLFDYGPGETDFGEAGNLISNSTYLSDREYADFKEMSLEKRQEFLKSLGLREWNALEEVRLMKEECDKTQTEIEGLFSLKDYDLLNLKDAPLPKTEEKGPPSTKSPASQSGFAEGGLPLSPIVPPTHQSDSPISPIVPPVDPKQNVVWMEKQTGGMTGCSESTGYTGYTGYTGTTNIDGKQTAGMMGTTNIKHPKCSLCTIRASYGIPGSSPTRCSVHKEAGMIVKPMSICLKRACDNTPLFGINKPIHCEEHKNDGDTFGAKGDTLGAKGDINLVEQKCVCCDRIDVVDEKGLSINFCSKNVDVVKDDPKTYKCGLCDTKYDNEDTFLNHVKTIHKGVKKVLRTYKNVVWCVEKK